MTGRECVRWCSGGELLHVSSAGSVWVTMKVAHRPPIAAPAPPRHVSFLGHSGQAPQGDGDEEWGSINKITLCVSPWRGR